MSELKPCPFCGATPLLYDLLDTHGGFSIECPTVGCDTDKMKRTKAEVIAEWNRRAQPAQAGQVLTDEDIDAAWRSVPEDTSPEDMEEAISRAIEQAVLAKRVPMTDEQVMAAFVREPIAVSRHDFTQGIRYAEVYHGIVGEKGGA